MGGLLRFSDRPGNIVPAGFAKDAAFAAGAA